MVNVTDALSQITDAGKFELIATSVLRYAEPEIYGNVSHQGVNPQGKTVKAPLDNVGWFQSDDMIVCIAHTTTSKNDLEVKWLRDLDKVKPRKEAKPTGSDGDLTKAIKEIKKVREEQPNIKARLALAINCEEGQELRVKVEKLASDNNIELDIWSVSRLADFLNINPDGQVIRHHHFGVQPTTLSKQLLLEIGKKSLSNLAFNQDTFIEREVDDVDTNTLIIGMSGVGKTTYCIDLLNKHLTKNKPVLVLTDASVTNSLSLAEAIDKELKRYQTELMPNSGQLALSLCSEYEPLLILIEDINRSSDSSKLLRKIISWSNTEPSSILLCPVWQRIVSKLSFDEIRNLQKQFNLQNIENYNDNEATQAILIKSRHENLSVDELTASAVAKQLGNDPLLISLADLSANNNNQNILEHYIQTTINAIATNANCLAYEVEDAIHNYSLFLFKDKKIQGCERDISHLAQELKEPFKVVLQDAQLFRLSLEQERHIFARHDRLNFYLMARAIKKHLLDDSLDLSDPYFSEVIGMACVLSEIDATSLYTISLQNSLVAFYCYVFSAKIKSSYKNTAIQNIQKWLSEPNHQTENFEYQIYASLRLLNEIFDDSVPTVLNTYPKEFHNYTFNEVSFKYGNLAHGLRWLISYPFDISIPSYKTTIDFVFNKHGTHLIPKICQLLEDETVGYELKDSLFQLIGYTENPVFAIPLRTAFKQIPEDKLDYRMFFWASARVCDDDPESLLEPVFDYWESLSDEENEHRSTEKADFAYCGLDFKFTQFVPQHSIDYIIKQTSKRQDLEFYIAFMLRDIDNPNVLELHANRRAHNERQGNHNFGSVIDNLRRRDNERKKLSIESKSRLLQLSENSNNDEFLRKQAFILWEVNQHSDDLISLQSVASDDVRYETAIMGRARRNDISVIDELIKKIEDKPTYWWQAARYIWHEKLESMFIETVSQLDKNAHENELWMVGELFEKLSIESSEKILIENWEKLKVHNKFIHIAINIATPKLKKLVESELALESNISDILKYFTYSIGIRTEGRKGIYRIEQMEAWQPYFKYLDDMKLSDLSEVCLKNGWHSFIDVIEPLIKEKRFRSHIEIDTSYFDDALNGKRNHLHWWISDQKKVGWSHAEVVNALFDWFNKNKSEKALNVISNPLIESGMRKDYQRLEEDMKDIEDWSTKDTVLKQIYFCVYSRTLN